MGRLEGKSVVITGAGSGIGRAASLLFTKEGAKLIAVDRSDAVKETVAQVRKAGGTAEAVMADAGLEADVKAFIDKAVSAYGRLDAIWANAGISGGLVPLAEQTVEQWQEILRINLIGPFLAIKHSMPHMIKQKYGAIVCTASVAGLKSGASGHPYAASKAGVISLVQTTAYSLSGTGVRINAVCPGLIETGMTKPIFDNAKQRGTDGKIGQLNPLKRAGQPHELAAMGLFLASDEASYVNAVCGQTDLDRRGFPSRLVLPRSNRSSSPRTRGRRKRVRYFKQLCLQAQLRDLAAQFARALPIFRTLR
jgi:NAD(P)-dependent dehydrogenase (short-subunit alcohol dehydrogenase family)